MKRKFTLVFIFIVFSFLKLNTAKAQVNEQDSLVLVDFYNSTNGPEWANYSSHWLTKAPVSTWYGIGLTPDGKRVQSISLSRSNLSGRIPVSLGNLKNLNYLDLSHNGLKHDIPSSLGKAVSLEYLNLSSNYLTDSIRSSFGNLFHLQTLDLSYNQLNSDIPSSIGNLTNLIYLDLSRNPLVGSIPTSLGNLINLQTLYISQDNLSGKIPSELGNLDSVSRLSLRYNSLSGGIPSSFSNLSNLFELDLSHNQLSGNIPSSFGNFSNLFELDLNNNQLSGNIPSLFGNLSNLRSLNLSNNQLSGNIPSSLADIPYMIWLFLSNNQLSGEIPQSFNKLHWQYLSLDHNQLSGEIPKIKIPSAISIELHLEYNNFTFSGMSRLVNDFPYYAYYYYSPQANIKLNKNGNILSVYAGGTNALANNTYNWYKNGSLYKTTVGDSAITIHGKGSYYATVTNSVATALTLYSDTLNYLTGDNFIADELNIENKISLAIIYPNPAKTNAILSFNADGKYAITVTDVSGKSLQTKTGIAIKGTNIIQLDVSNYANGVYLITIVDERNKKQTVRLNKE